jgi:hypothetical protein
VERAFDRDDAVAFGMAGVVLILAARLNDAFHRFGARVAEEHGVGKAVGDQLRGDPFLAGHAIDIRGVPHLAQLRGQRGQQARMSMAERSHGDTRGIVEIASPGGIEQVSTFAPLESEVGTRINGHNRRGHHALPNAAGG